jgi:hypothetical protein
MYATCIWCTSSSYAYRRILIAKSEFSFTVHRPVGSRCGWRILTKDRRPDRPLTVPMVPPCLASTSPHFLTPYSSKHPFWLSIPVPSHRSNIECVPSFDVYHGGTINWLLKFYTQWGGLQSMELSLHVDRPTDSGVSNIINDGLCAQFIVNPLEDRTGDFMRHHLLEIWKCLCPF